MKHMEGGRQIDRVTNVVMEIDDEMEQGIFTERESSVRIFVIG
jgi:hypothetical protein